MSLSNRDEGYSDAIHGNLPSSGGSHAHTTRPSQQYNTNANPHQRTYTSTIGNTAELYGHGGPGNGDNESSGGLAYGQTDILVPPASSAMGSQALNEHRGQVDTGYGVASSEPPYGTVDGWASLLNERSYEGSTLDKLPLDFPRQMSSGYVMGSEIAGDAHRSEGQVFVQAGSSMTNPQAVMPSILASDGQNNTDQWPQFVWSGLPPAPTDVPGNSVHDPWTQYGTLEMPLMGSPGGYPNTGPYHSPDIDPFPSQQELMSSPSDNVNGGQQTQSYTQNHYSTPTNQQRSTMPAMARRGRPAGQSLGPDSRFHPYRTIDPRSETQSNGYQLVSFDAMQRGRQFERQRIQTWNRDERSSRHLGIRRMSSEGMGSHLSTGSAYPPGVFMSIGGSSDKSMIGAGPSVMDQQVPAVNSTPSAASASILSEASDPSQARELKIKTLIASAAVYFQNTENKPACKNYRAVRSICISDKDCDFKQTTYALVGGNAEPIFMSKDTITSLEELGISTRQQLVTKYRNGLEVICALCGGCSAASLLTIDDAAGRASFRKNVANICPHTVLDRVDGGEMRTEEEFVWEQKTLRETFAPFHVHKGTQYQKGDTYARCYSYYRRKHDHTKPRN